MAGSLHVFRKVRASGPGLVARPPGHRLVHPVGLVHDLREDGEIVRGNAVALAAVAAVEAIVPPLDDGETVSAPDQQMSALLLDNGRVHVLFLFAAQRCSDDPQMQGYRGMQLPDRATAGEAPSAYSELLYFHRRAKSEMME